MQKALLILFSVCAQLALAQTGTITVKKPGTRSVLVIKQETAGDCRGKAILLKGDSMQIDHCYDPAANVFSADEIIPLRTEPACSRLARIEKTEWLEMQDAIDRITNCDYAQPFIIRVTENERTETYSLKRHGGCYTGKTREVMEGMEDYFNKLK